MIIMLTNISRVDFGGGSGFPSFDLSVTLNNLKVHVVMG